MIQKNENGTLKVITVNVEQVYLDYISELIKRGFYNSRSEYVRVALRDSNLERGNNSAKGDNYIK